MHMVHQFKKRLTIANRRISMSNAPSLNLGIQTNLIIITTTTTTLTTVQHTWMMQARNGCGNTAFYKRDSCQKLKNTFEKKPNLVQICQQFHQEPYKLVLQFLLHIMHHRRQKRKPQISFNSKDESIRNNKTGSEKTSLFQKLFSIYQADKATSKALASIPAKKQTKPIFCIKGIINNKNIHNWAWGWSI